jgi:hypothetical protein
MSLLSVANKKFGFTRPHGLFVPNDGDQRKWMTSACDGNGRKLAADRQRSIDYSQSLALAIGKENVPVCVRGHNDGRSRDTLSRTVLERCPHRYCCISGDLRRF